MTSKKKSPSSFAALRRLFSTRHFAPIIAALIVTFGPTLSAYIAVRTAPAEELTDNSLLALVPDQTLKAVGRMRRPRGMGEWQFANYIRACEKAGVSPQRITQTIGRARLSAGYHAQDGVAREDSGDRNPYCAAIDIDTRDLTIKQIKKLNSALTDASYANWYRFKGKFFRVRHIHAVFVGYPMKPQLRAQVVDFLRDRTGLVGHARETFFRATTKQKIRLKTLFLKRNRFGSMQQQQSFGGAFLPHLHED